MGRVSEALKRAAGQAAGDDVDQCSHAPGDDRAALGAGLVDTLPLTAEPTAGRAYDLPRSAEEAAVPGSSRLVFRDVHGGQRGQLAGLVDRLFLPVSSDPVHSVAFMAVGEGVKSGPIAAASAELIARQAKASVCVVDANFAVPSLHNCFGVSDTAASAPALARAPITSLVQKVRSNLWVLTASGADKVFGGPTESTRPQMAEFIAAFDYVIFDIEPVGVRGEAGAVAPLVDGVILVVAESTRREVGRRVVNILRDTGTAVLGAVLTNRRFPIPDFFYRRI